MAPRSRSAFSKMQRLAALEDSCLEIVTKKRHVSLPWFYMKDFKQGVKIIVEKGLQHYIKKLQGVPLAYGKINWDCDKVPVIEDQPCLHFRVLIEYALFKPRIGAILDGVVSRVDEGQIVCCIYDVITANMYRNKKTKKHFKIPEVGSSCKFKVEGIRIHKTLLQVHGQIISSE